jgi:hypothetical protein
MAGSGKNLEDWLQLQPKNAFPANGKTDYPGQYKQVAKFFREHVHPEVEKGAAIHDRVRGMFLNNHGAGHIAMVIRRASELMRVAQKQMGAYEAYMLLFAIHLHDAGNMLGRQEHEKRCWKIMQDLGTLAGTDEPEKRFIAMIAMAHGGHIEGDKDTIADLQPSDTVLSHSIRPQFLAALLRFADELADDSTRSSRFSLQAGAVHEASEIFHRYSEALHSVVVGERDVQLVFDLTREVALKKYQKGTERRYLLDEIFDRTLKMHLERCYCMRFLSPEIRIEEIRVKINVYDASFVKSLLTIPYTLKESGYPKSPPGQISALCPSLAKWNGKALKEKLAKRAKSNGKT